MKIGMIIRQDWNELFASSYHYVRQIYRKDLGAQIRYLRGEPKEICVGTIIALQIFARMDLLQEDKMQ
jgi:hypothetical protein